MVQNHSFSWVFPPYNNRMFGDTMALAGQLVLYVMRHGDRLKRTVPISLRYDDIRNTSIDTDAGTGHRVRPRSLRVLSGGG